MSKLRAAIIGASRDRSKFGNKSVRAHAQFGYEVCPVNPKETEIEGLVCYPSILEVPTPLDRVSLYLPPEKGFELLDSIAESNPGEVWLNPGTESEAVIRKAESLGLKVMVGCSIVDLGVSPAQFPD